MMHGRNTLGLLPMSGHVTYYQQPPRRQVSWPFVAVAAATVLVVLFVVLVNVVASKDSITPPTWGQIQNANYGTLADNVCRQLSDGATPQAVVGRMPYALGSNAAELTRVLVHLGCPQYLVDFK